MMAAISPLIDSMLKEYLLFRGFTGTLKALESEIKADKDKSFRVEKVVEQIQLLIDSYDLAGLKSYWSHLDRRFFSKLSHDAYKNVCKLETSVLRLYLVHAIQNSKPEKVGEFFERSVSDLQNLPTWKDWFALPFLKSPEQNPMFSIYFTRIWQESVMVALYNCISTVFSNMTLPSLLNFEKETQKIERMKEENEELRQQIMSLQGELVKLRNEKTTGRKNVSVQTIMETMNVAVGEECDYLVVNTKTLAPKEPASAPPKKHRWKLKGNKDSKAKKQQQDEPSLKIKKKLSYEKKEEADLSIKVTRAENPNPQQSPRIIIKNDLNMDKSPDANTYTLGIDSPNIKKSKDLQPATISASFNPSRSRSQTSDIITGSLDHFQVEVQKPFILLSQEEYRDHFSPIVNCRFSGDGRHVGSIDTDGVIKVWQCHPEPLTQGTIASKFQSLSLDWVPKPDGKLLCGNLTGKVSLYDVSAKKIMLDAHVDSKYQRIVAISCSPNGSSFVCSASSGMRKRSESYGFSASKRNVQLKQLHSMTESNKPSMEGTIFDWDMKTFKEKAELVLDPYPACIHCMSYNHNGTLLVTGAADGMIRLFDMRTCDCLVGWHAHSTDVLDVQFSVDETSLFSLGADGKLCVWDVHKVSFKNAEFSMHDNCTGLNSLYEGASSNNQSESRPGGRLFAFDTDGKYMITCASNGALMYLAETKTVLEQVMTIPGQRSAVTALDWNSSPNCSICVTGQSNGMVQISSLLRR